MFKSIEYLDRRGSPATDDKHLPEPVENGGRNLLEWEQDTFLIFYLDFLIKFISERSLPLNIEDISFHLYHYDLYTKLALL
jgi:hypothetical protein